MYLVAQVGASWGTAVSELGPVADLFAFNATLAEEWRSFHGHVCRLPAEMGPLAAEIRALSHRLRETVQAGLTTRAAVLEKEEEDGE